MASEHVFPLQPTTSIGGSELHIRYITSPAEHPLDGAYVERFYLPTLGPSSILLLRRIAGDHRPTPSSGRTIILDLEALAGSMGLGTGTGPNSTIRKTIRRLINFGIIHEDQLGYITIPSHLPPVPPHKQRRWPTELQAEHNRLTAGVIR